MNMNNSANSSGKVAKVLITVTYVYPIIILIVRLNTIFSGNILTVIWGIWVRALIQMSFAITSHLCYRIRNSDFWKIAGIPKWNFSSHAWRFIWIANLMQVVNYQRACAVFLHKSFVGNKKFTSYIGTGNGTLGTWMYVTQMIYNMLIDFFQLYNNIVFISKYMHVRDQLFVIYEDLVRITQLGLSEVSFQRNSSRCLALLTENIVRMRRLRKDYMSVVFIWVLVGLITLVSQVFIYCTSHGQVIPAYEIALQIFPGSARLFVIVYVAHSTSSITESVKEALVDLKCLIMDQPFIRKTSHQVDQCLLVCDSKTFAFNVHGVFTLGWPMLINIAAFVLANSIVIYQFAATDSPV